jgi:hypothetical protein
MFSHTTLCFTLAPYVSSLYLMFYYVGTFTDPETGTFSISPSDLRLKEISNDPRFPELLEHPFLLMLGLMYTLTTEFGDRKDNKEFLPFLELSSLWQMQLFFSDAVEANLLFVLLLSMFVPYSPVPQFNILVQLYHVTYDTFFTQVTNMVTDARNRKNDHGDSFYSYEQIKLVQVVVAAICPFPTTKSRDCNPQQEDDVIKKALLLSLEYCYVCTYLLYMTLCFYYFVYVFLCYCMIVLCLLMFVGDQAGAYPVQRAGLDLFHR